MKNPRPSHEALKRVRMSFHEHGIKEITNRQLMLGAQHGGDHFLNGLNPERTTRFRKLLRTYHTN